MLKKESGLKKKRDFALALKNGTSFRTDDFLLKVFLNQLNKNRFGFVVSKRVSGKAVERNKIKRRLKAIVGQEAVLFKNGFDVVFLANKNVLRKDFSLLKKTTVDVFRRAGIYA